MKLGLKCSSQITFGDFILNVIHEWLQTIYMTVCDQIKTTSYVCMCLIEKISAPHPSHIWFSSSIIMNQLCDCRSVCPPVSVQCSAVLSHNAQSGMTVVVWCTCVRPKCPQCGYSHDCLILGLLMWKYTAAQLLTDPM